MRGQSQADDEHGECAGSDQRGTVDGRAGRRMAALCRGAVFVAIAGCSAMALVSRPPEPERPSELVNFTSSAPPEIASLVRQAAEVAQRLAERFPDDPNALNVVAWVHSRFGGSDEAVRHWQRCLELDPAFGDAHYSIGVVAREAGDHEKAAECFRKALESAPDSSSLAEDLAQALMKLGRMDEAFEVVETNAKAHPRSTESLVLLGQIHAELGAHGKAKQSFEAAIRTSPESASAHYGAANACAALGETEESKEHFEKFKVLKAKDAEVHRDWLKRREGVDLVRWDTAEVYTSAAKVYVVHQHFRTAQAHLRKGGDLCPTHPECLHLLAWLYEQEGRIDEAIETWLRVKEHKPESVVALVRLGSLYVRLGEFEAAEEAFLSVIQISPDWAGGYAGLANLYLDANRKLPEAQRLAWEVVEREPLAEHYFTLCLVCQKNGDVTEARRAIDQAVALDPGNREYQQIRDLIHEDSER